MYLLVTFDRVAWWSYHNLTIPTIPQTNLLMTGQYGKTQPLCYCFTPSYWYGKRRRRRNSAVAHHDDTEQENECPHIEPVPIEVKSLNHLRILNIKKTYRVGGKPLEAVKGSYDYFNISLMCSLHLRTLFLQIIVFSCRQLQSLHNF